MRILTPYKTGLLALLLLSMLACRDNSKSEKDLDRRLSLWYKDKLPYGTYVAFENLSSIFPDAEIRMNWKLSDLDGAAEGKKVMIAIVHKMDADSAEMSTLMDFIGKGNQVFISAFDYSDSLLHSLGIRPGYAVANYLFPPVSSMDSLQLSVYSPVGSDSLTFAYPGDGYDNYFTRLDTQYTRVLGRDLKGRPNLIRMGYKGGGALYLHFAPLAFSNFFLLHKNNKVYYDNVMSYMPSSAREVVWDQYFRYRDRKDSGFSALGFILRNRALRWAFWLLLLLFLLIYAFDSKRKQRTVPVIEPLRNTSLDFVKTIGRLYYQRKDNYNLSQKMVAHFQDHVRRKYNLQASVLDEAFVERLAYKTGLPKETVKDMVYDMNRFPHQGWLTDEDLLAFNQKMEEFYKQA